MTVLSFPCSRDQIDKLCRHLFYAHTVETNALNQRDFASRRRAKDNFARIRAELEALGISESEAMRRGRYDRRP